MTRNLRIKWIGGGVPWPLDRGVHVRQYHILRALSEIAEVDAVLRCHPDQTVPAEIGALCRRVVLQPRTPAGNRRALGRRLSQIAGECRGWPLDQPPMARQTLTPAAQRLLDEPADLTWVARLSAALILGIPGGPDTVLDLDDIEHRKLGRGARLLNLPRRLRQRIAARAWAEQEWAALRRYGRVLVCSEGDRRYLGADNVRVVPNGTTVPPGVSYHDGTPGRLLFVGSMDYAPNDDGIRWFLSEILPRIRARVPYAHVHIAGHRPGPAVRMAHDPPKIQVLGRVEDVAPHARDAALSIVPLRVGGGTRLKILESLALKTPVVSTTLGAEGLELMAGLEIAIADDPASFADACVALLGSPAARRGLAERGYERVRSLYDWSSVGSWVQAVVEDALVQSKESTSCECWSSTVADSPAA